MPLYSVSTPKKLTDEMNEKLANLIMNVHCGITGAPETFVNVIYHHNVPLKDGISVNIMANVRKGRTPDMNSLLKAEMLKQISQLLSIEEYGLELSLFEVPARWVMEGGEILPEPGEEAMCDWLQKGHA